MSPSADPSSVIPSHDALVAEPQDLDSKPSASISASISASTSTTLEDNPKIHLSSHPVLFHKITALRSAKTPPGTFRSLLRQVTYHLGYEATQNLTVQKGLPVTVPLGKESKPDQEDLRCSEDCGIKLLDRVALVPILRSGLGMTDAMLELLPNSAVHHIGMYRTPGTHVAPIQYFNRLPRGKCGSDVAYVLDPMVGSAATVMAVVSILKQWGVPKIHIVTVVASRAGLELLTKTHPDVSVTVGMVDDHLTDCGIVLPGMGDVGDRLFGTGNHNFEDGGTEPNHIQATSTTSTTTAVPTSSAASEESVSQQPSTKRKRSASLELEMP